jgi:hypothetical protein
MMGGMSDPPEVDLDFPNAVHVEVMAVGKIVVSFRGEIVDEGDYEASLKAALRKAQEGDSDA